EPTLIYLQSKYSFNGFHRVMISTGDKIMVSEWDFVKKRAIVSKKNQANADINTWLDKIASTFKSEYRSCLIDGIEPTSTTIKSRVEKALKIGALNINPEVKTLTEFIDKFIRDSKG